MNKMKYVKSNYSVTKALEELNQIKDLLSEAYDRLNGEAADYFDSLIDYSLVDDLGDLLQNIGNAIEG